MKFNDPIALWGIFNMAVYDFASGEKKLLRRFTKKNQIVNTGRAAIVEIMACPDDTGYQEERQLWSISAGTNNTPPQITDTTSTMVEVWQHQFTVGVDCIPVTTAPNSFYIHVTSTMLTTDAIGSPLVEAGVFTRGDNDDPTLSTTRALYARQVHPLITKTATMVIEYDWRFGISIQ